MGASRSEVRVGKARKSHPERGVQKRKDMFWFCIYAGDRTIQDYRGNTQNRKT